MSATAGKVHRVCHVGYTNFGCNHNINIHIWILSCGIILHDPFSYLCQTFKELFIWNKMLMISLWNDVLHLSVKYLLRKKSWTPFFCSNFSLARCKCFHFKNCFPLKKKIFLSSKPQTFFLCYYIAYKFVWNSKTYLTPQNNFRE